MYVGIPACTNAFDESKLRESLEAALKTVLEKKKPCSPERAYLIGLAYLNGVDVEVDHPRAVSLISSAANNGNAEAAGKLHDMYSIGLGVKKDNAVATAWLEKK